LVSSAVEFRVSRKKMSGVRERAWEGEGREDVKAWRMWLVERDDGRRRQ